MVQYVDSKYKVSTLYIKLIIKQILKPTHSTLYSILILKAKYCTLYSTLIIITHSKSNAYFSVQYVDSKSKGSTLYIKLILKTK